MTIDDYFDDADDEYDFFNDSGLYEVAPIIRIVDETARQHPTDYIPRVLALVAAGGWRPSPEGLEFAYDRAKKLAK